MNSARPARPPSRVEREARHTFARRLRSTFAPPPVRSRRREIIDIAGVVFGSALGGFHLIRGERVDIHEWTALGLAASFLVDLLIDRVRTIWTDPVEPSHSPRS